mgnify:CR=1 FL=1|jgi:hypothetical protein
MKITEGAGMKEKKDFWIAFGLNFIFPGAGHWYAGETKVGGRLVVGYSISLLITLFTGYSGALMVFIWVYSLIKIKEVVEDYNYTLRCEIKAEEKEQEKIVTPEKFVSSINKANQLFAAEMISEAEFQAKKQTIISDLQFNKFVGDLDELLLALAPLKKSETITDDELQAIKKRVPN